jgi:hypothetical protein
MAQKRAAKKTAPKKTSQPQNLIVHLETNVVSSSPEWDAFWQMPDALVIAQLAAEPTAA